MEMGIQISMGFPWDSHGNGSSFGLLMGMGIPYYKIPTGSANNLLFLHSDSLINVEQ